MGDYSTIIVVLNLLTKQIWEVVKHDFHNPVYGPISLFDMPKIFYVVDCRYRNKRKENRPWEYDLATCRRHVWGKIKNGEYNKLFKEAKAHKMSADEKKTYLDITYLKEGNEEVFTGKKEATSDQMQGL